MSPALAESQYAESGLWKARDELVRYHLTNAESEWNMVLVESRPATGLIRHLEAVIAELGTLRRGS